MSGCPKNSVTGRPYKTGFDACKFDFKHTRLRKCAGQWEAARFREICRKCGLDLTEFNREREKETAEIQEKKVG